MDNTDYDYAEVVRETQELINSGVAWQLEGSVGRHAMAMIESGECMLGEKGYRDYWGNYVPSRYEVEEGTKGSESYCVEHATSTAQEAHERLNG
jgi:hypothetical protein